MKYMIVVCPHIDVFEVTCFRLTAVFDKLT